MKREIGKNIGSGIRSLQENEKRNVGFQRRFCVTEDFIYRLGLYAELQGHAGCVNCLQWNDKGTLLASGSDDFRVILWDPFARRKLHAIQTGHINNIFSVQFIPQTNDRLLVTGAGDGKVRVHDVNTPSRPTTSAAAGTNVADSLHVFSCHFARVKRVVTHQAEPHLIWSAGEDGLVMQFDLREPASCHTICNHALVNLNAHLGPDSEIKCLAINPVRPEMMAVGANDHYVRIYDRRMITPKDIRLRSDPERVVWDRSAVMSLSLENVDYNFPPHSVQYYIAGHLPVKQTDMRRRYRPLTSTYLTFSPCGRDLLVNLGGEQIYLFDLTENRRSLLADFRKYFDNFSSDEDLRPSQNSNGLQYTNGLHFGRPSYSNGHYSVSNGRNGTSSSCKLARLVKSLSNKDLAGQSTKNRPQLPPRAELLKQKANSFFQHENFNMAVAYYSEALCLAPKSPLLHANRAAAYLKREWDGDVYAALKDCYVTLQFEPDNLKAHFRLVKCLYDLKQYKSSEKCLEMFKIRYPDQAGSNTCVELANEIHSAIFEIQENRSPKRKRTRSHSLLVDTRQPNATDDVFSTGASASRSESPVQAPENLAPNDAQPGTPTHRRPSTFNVVITGAPGQAPLPFAELTLPFPDHFDDPAGGFSPVENETDDAAGSAPLSEQEISLREAAFDYELRFCGHCNTTTDIKEANFFGSNGEYIVGGSDDGKFFIWDRKTCNIVRVIVGDESIVNCLQPHPSQCLLASSGIDSTVKLWAPRPDDGSPDPRDVPDQSNAALANQRRMNADPLEVMLMNMGYRLGGLMDAATAAARSPQDGNHREGGASSRDSQAVQCHPS